MRKGSTLPDEVKKRISNTLKGRKLSESTIAKMRLRRHSEETKQKLREMSTGRKMPAEAIEKTRQSNIGRKRSEETKRKLSDANKKRVFSEEKKKEISDKKKETFRKRRELGLNIGRPKGPMNPETIKKREETKRLKRLEPGYVSPIKGRKQPEEEKLKRAKSLKKAYDEGRMISYFELNDPWNKGLSKETDERVKAQSELIKSYYKEGKLVRPTKGQTKETSEMVRRQSEGIKNKILSGWQPTRNSCFSRTRFEEELGHIVRSNLEYDFCKILKDKYNELYEYEKYSFRIKLDNDNDTIYIPDIYLNNYNMFIELKGYEGMTESINKTKKFIEQYPMYETTLLFYDDVEKLKKNLPDTIEEFVNKII